MPFVTLNNQEDIFYLETGNKNNETLLLVHGNMSSSFHYNPLFEALGKTYHVIAMDLRGFGESSYKTPIETIDDFADDIYDFMTLLNIEKASLAGWSTGGAIILSLASRYPQSVHKLILIESASVLGYPVFEKDESFQPILTKPYQSKEAMAKDPVQIAPMVSAIESGQNAVLRSVWEAVIYNVKVPENIDDYIKETMKQRNLVDVDWALMTFNMTDLHNGVVAGNQGVNHIEAPILNIWGQKDLVVPEIMFKQNETYLKTATSLVLENGSHSPITDEPETLIKEITAFLNT